MTDKMIRVPSVDALAQIIREVDGRHDLGAGALAEKIVEALLRTPAKEAVTPAAHTDTEGDPLDTPLPCEITIGATTFGKGVKLRTLVTRARRDYELIRATMTPKDIAQAATFAEKYGSARKPDDLEAMRRDAERMKFAAEAPNLHGQVYLSCRLRGAAHQQALDLAHDAEKMYGAERVSEADLHTILAEISDAAADQQQGGAE